MSETFTCSQCGGTFPKDWSDEDALAAMKKDFPDLPEGTPVSAVCRTCYDAMMAWHKTRTQLLTNAEVHNQVVGRLVQAIVEVVTAAGGGGNEILVLAESVVVGVVLACEPWGHTEKALDVMLAQAKQRVGEARLARMPTQGSA